jgi:hypothetical protein
MARQFREQLEEEVQLEQARKAQAVSAPPPPQPSPAPPPPPAQGSSTTQAPPAAADLVPDKARPSAEAAER